MATGGNLALGDRHWKNARLAKTFLTTHCAIPPGTVADVSVEDIVLLRTTVCGTFRYFANGDRLECRQ